MTPAGRFAVATAILGASAVGAVVLIRRSRGTRGARRLSGPRGITTKEALQKKLDALRRDIRKLARGDEGGDYREAFLRLRKRLDKAQSDSWGFFPEANDMADAVLPELIAARDSAGEAYSKQLDEQRREAHEAYREEQRARPDYFMLKDKYRR